MWSLWKITSYDFDHLLVTGSTGHSSIWSPLNLSQSFSWCRLHTGTQYSGGSRILKRGIPVCNKARIARLPRGSGGMPPKENVGFLTFWDRFWCILGVKFQKQELNLVAVVGGRRIEGRRGCKAAGYPRKARENKRSHTDSISPSLAAEGAMHK